MSKLQEFMDFLNDEEIGFVDRYKKESAATLAKATPEKAAELIARFVIHCYVGMDRAYTITKEQDRRWTEVQKKASDLGIYPKARFS